MGLMKHRGLTLTAALQAIRIGRPMACPNHGFMQALTFLEEEAGDFVAAQNRWLAAFAPSKELLATRLRAEADALHAEVDAVEVEVAHARAAHAMPLHLTKRLEDLELKFDNATPMDGDDEQAKCIRKAAMKKLHRLLDQLRS